MKVAIVTGASRGIGRDVALSLAQTGGFHLCITGRAPGDSANAREGQAGTLEETKALVARVNPAVRVLIQYCDVVSVTQCEAVVDACVRELGGRVDVLVLNAIYQGPGAYQRVDQLRMDELTRLVHGNVLGQVAMVQRVIPLFQRQGSGCVITLVSSSSWTMPTRPVDKGGFMSFGYVATKTAIAKLIPLLAVELAESVPQGRFFNLDPGLVLTEGMKVKGTADKFKKWPGVVSSSVTGDAVRILVTADAAHVKKWSGAEFVKAVDVVGAGSGVGAGGKL